MEVLQNIDKNLTVSLFATLAGLSLAVTSFLQIRVGELRRTVSDQAMKYDKAPGQLKTPEAREYRSLRRARTSAGLAFMGFVLSAGAAFGFDADEDVRLWLQRLDVIVSGTPALIAFGLLAIAGWSILSSDSAENSDSEENHPSNRD